jgi:hypothetical protein
MPQEKPLVKERNFLSQEETYCYKKKPPVNGINFLWQEETSCQMKKPPVTIINLLSQEEPSCNTKKNLKIDIKMDEHNAEEEIAENVPLIPNAYKIYINTMRNHWKENNEWNTICHRKKCPVTERKFMSQEETSSHKKKLTV